MLILALLLAAAPPPASTAERRLSQAEIDKVLADAAAAREATDAQMQAQRSLVPVVEEPREPIPVMGAVGVSVGSHGSRSAYGTATIGTPGRSATISISGGRDRYRYDGYAYGPGYDFLP